MKASRYFYLLIAFVLLFALQAGAEHAVHHAFEDLTQHQDDDDKNGPHSDNCSKCADYAHLGSALKVAAYNLTPPLLLPGAAIPYRFIAFRSILILAADARGPPVLLQKVA
jgi:hypothetical protein